MRLGLDGKNSFNSKIAKDSFKNKAKKLAFGKIDSLLNAEVPKHDVVYEVDSGSQNLYADTKTNYDASQIIGSSGGTLFAQVFSDKNANDIMQSYKNMNILAG